MSGKRLKKPPKGQMARTLVLYCVLVLTATALWATVLKTIDHAADLTDVLTFVGAAFGGELLLLAFKRVFAKPQSEEVIEDDGIS